MKLLETGIVRDHVMIIELFLEHRKLNWPPLKSEQLGLQI